MNLAFDPGELSKDKGGDGKDSVAVVNATKQEDKVGLPRPN